MALKEAAFWVASKLEGYLNSVRGFFGAHLKKQPLGRNNCTVSQLKILTQASV